MKFKQPFFLSKILLLTTASILTIGILIVIIQTFGIDTNIKWMLRLTKDAQRLADIKTIRTALERYYKDNNHYPISTPICSSWVTDKEDKNYFLLNLTIL